jgi:hypothetical protein
LEKKIKEEADAKKKAYDEKVKKIEQEAIAKEQAILAAKQKEIVEAAEAEKKRVQVESVEKAKRITLDAVQEKQQKD